LILLFFHLLFPYGAKDIYVFNVAWDKPTNCVLHDYVEGLTSAEDSFERSKRYSLFSPYHEFIRETLQKYSESGFDSVSIYTVIDKINKRDFTNEMLIFVYNDVRFYLRSLGLTEYKDNKDIMYVSWKH
jgi:hypothetical protein